MILIREAEARDLEGIVECHCSDVEKWHGFRDGKVVELGYGELTPYERCHFNCGEWLDRGVCQLHLRLLGDKNEKAFVAELEGKVVGEAEVCLAVEPPPYGKYAFLTAVMVHRKFRRRGIGIALVQHTIRWARERECVAYDTIPDNERAKALYNKADLKPIQELYKMRADIKSLKETPVKASVKELLLVDDPSREFLLVTGHVSPSIHIWRNAFFATRFLKFKGYKGRVRPPIAVQAYINGLEGIVLLVPAIYDPLKCFLHIFIKPEMVKKSRGVKSLASVSLELAKQNHLTTVETSVQKKMLPLFRKVGFSLTQRKDQYMRLNMHQVSNLTGHLHCKEKLVKRKR